MYTWCFVNLGDGMMAASARAEIKDRFEQVFTIEGKPPEMAVFIRSETEGRLHCEVFAYFSPAANTVAKEFDAQLCEKPARSGLGLLAGDECSWSLLFPESAG